MNKIFKSFSILTTGAILTRFISFIFKIYLSRKIGAEILGLYQIVFSVFLLLSCISTAGIPVTSSRLIAEHYNQPDKINKILSSSLLISFIFAIIPICLIIWCPSFFKLFLKDLRLYQILILLIPLFITTSIYSILRSYLWGSKEFKLFTLTEFLDEAFKIIATIIIFRFFVDLYIDAIFAYAIALVIGDILLVIILIIISKNKKFHLSKPLYIKQIIKSSTPITTSRLLASILSFFISIILPSLLVSKFNLSRMQATSEYGRASGMVMSLIFAPNTIISSITTVLIPEIAQLKNSNSTHLLKNKLNYTLLIALCISSICFIFYTGMGKELGFLLYKDIYVGNYLAFSAIMMIPISVNSIATSYLNTLEKEKQVFYSYFISSIFLVLIILFTPKYIGIYSYFVALTTFHTINCLINLCILNRIIQVSYRLIKLSLLIVIVSIILSFILICIGKLLYISLFMKVILLSIIGCFLLLIFIMPFYAYFSRKNPKFTLE